MFSDDVPGMIVSLTRHAETERQFLGRVDGAFLNRTARIFTLDSPAGVFPPDSSIPGAAFFINARRFFGKFAVGRSLRVFKSNWGQRFYEYVNSLVIPGGDLFIPCTDDPGAGLYTFSDLCLLFGQNGKYLAKNRLAKFRAVERMPQSATGSTLSYLLDLPGIVIAEQMALQAMPDLANICHSDDIHLECLLDAKEEARRPRDDRTKASPLDWFTASARTDDASLPSYGALFGDAIGFATYVFAGVRYKFAIIKNIMLTIGRSMEGAAFSILAAHTERSSQNFSWMPI